MHKRKTLKLEDIPRYEALINAVKRAKRDMERGKYKLRDLALVSILTYTGCRLGEAMKLELKDLDFKNRTVRIHQEKKGGIFVRIVPIVSNIFWNIFEKYSKYFAYKDSKLFNISDREARNIVYNFTRKYLRRRIRPHAIRHSFAVFILRNTRDLEVVRRLLGHSNYNWLRVYLDYTQEDLEKTLMEAFEKIE